MEIPENVACSLLRMLLLAALSAFSFIYSINTSHAYGKDECGDYRPGMPIKERMAYSKCMNLRQQKEKQAEAKKQAEFDKLDHSIAMFKGVEFEPLTSEQMKLPQFRNKGSLQVNFDFITDKGKKVYRKKECTSFTVGITTFKADRHCFLYKKRDLEMDPELKLNASQTVTGAQLTLNEDIISPNVFDIDLRTVKYDDPIKYPYSESASFIIKQKIEGQYLGELLGYPAMSMDGQFIEGSLGTMPYPKGIENPCAAIYFNSDPRDDVYNRVLKFADTKNRSLLERDPEYRGLVTLNEDYIQTSISYDKDYKICGTGFTNHKNFELSIVNCYAGGLAHNQLATNCSQKPGFSGGDNYYINGIKNISVVVAQFNSRTEPTTLEEEGVFGAQANLSTLPHSHAMTVRYDPDTKKIVKTVLSPITGEQLAEKERQAAAK